MPMPRFPKPALASANIFAFYNSVQSRSALGARTPDQVYFDQPLLAAA
jgi:putative transposase